MNKIFINLILLIGAFLGLTSVGFDAYVNHVLIHAVDKQTLHMLKTALHYHALYAVIISAIGFLYYQQKNNLCVKLSAWIFIVGIFLFSFSIYLKVLTNINIWLRLTPFGGTLLMLGWFLLACSAFACKKIKDNNINF